MSVKIAVIPYSATGAVHRFVQAVAEGAEKAGAGVRLRRVPELAPESAMDANPAWRAHVDATGDMEVASLGDLEWAGAHVLGSPTRFGNVAAQLKQYADTSGGLWQRGVMADKSATAFTSAHDVHGGNESTLLALRNAFHHWGSVIVPPASPTRRCTRRAATPTGPPIPAPPAPPANPAPPARTPSPPPATRANGSPGSRSS